MISINWGTKVINVPRTDMTLLQASPEIRQLDLNTFRLTLKDLEDDEAGISFPTTHNHVAPIDVGGVTLARVVEIINGYTVTFEDGQYAVNLVGANTNLPDVANVNQVSIRSSNSGGLVQAPSSDPGAIWEESWENHMTVGTYGEVMSILLGMSQHNYVLDQTSYSAEGLLLSGRIRVFPTMALAVAATDGGVNEGEMHLMLVSAVPDPAQPNRLKIYKVIHPE